MPRVRPRLGGRVHEDPVEEVAAWRVEGIDAGTRPDRDLHGLAVGVMEHRSPDRRCARGDHLAEQPPSGQLKDARPHEAVGRDSVGAVGGPVEQGDASTCAC